MNACIVYIYFFSLRLCVASGESVLKSQAVVLYRSYKCLLCKGYIWGTLRSGSALYYRGLQTICFRLWKKHVWDERESSAVILTWPYWGRDIKTIRMAAWHTKEQSSDRWKMTEKRRESKKVNVDGLPFFGYRWMRKGIGLRDGCASQLWSTCTLSLAVLTFITMPVAIETVASTA